MKAEHSKKLHVFFHTYFGRMTPDSILLARRGPGPLEIATAFPELSSPQMADLLETLLGHIHMSAFYAPTPVRLTHDAVLAAFDKAIEELNHL